MKGDEIKIGVCWFDDPKVAESGWSSENGEAAKRVSGINELRTDIVWITNLTFRVFRNLNLSSTPHLKDIQYLRSGLDLIGKEIGLIESPPELVEALSAIASRTVRLGEKRYKHVPSEGGYRYTSLLSQHILPGFVRTRPNGSHVSEIEEGVRQSNQANQGMSGSKRPVGSVAHSFVFPRSAYANYLTGLKVPISNDWKELRFQSDTSEFGVVEGEVVSGTKSIFSKLTDLNKKHAVILRVHVLSMDRFYRPFATFGAGSMVNRGWATLPEVLELSRFSKLSISGGFMTELGNLPKELQMDIPQEFSFSRGLLLENHWVSLATSPSTGTQTSLSAYLRAYDRILCGRVAAMFARHSFVVGSYGTGRVTVYLRKGEQREAARLGLQMGLLAPFSLSREEAVYVDD